MTCHTGISSASEDTSHISATLSEGENITTNNTDAQIARQWVESNINALKPTEPTAGVREAIERHILATTIPPTMSDIEWDDDAHAGLCAEHPKYGTVGMLEKDTHGDILLIHAEEGRLRTRWTHPHHLTPLPGTHLDLTPRSGSEPETTPDHPTELTTLEDYRNAPEGTIVAQDSDRPFVLIYELWMSSPTVMRDHDEMAGIRRRVLRWGWGA